MTAYAIRHNERPDKSAHHHSASTVNRYPFLPGSGGLVRRLIMFALPIIGSGVVQQSFNSVDVAVVGRYIGPSALAAVGANGSVISLIITLFMGIALGSNVVISRYIGAGDDNGVRRAVSTQAGIAGICSVLLLLTGIMVARPLLTLLDTPEEVLDTATLYLKIYALGFPAMLIYNFVSAVLRSVGDTRRPFYWLVAGGVLNMVLNLYMVLSVGLGVEGVAIATVAGNMLAAIGVTRDLMREQGALRLDLRHIRPYGRELRTMLAIGLPAGLQGSVFAFSNVIIQSAINGFGPEAMAGSAAALVFELYAYFIISAMVQAALTFVSAAYGAKHFELCSRLMWICMTIGMAGSAVVNLTVATLPSAFCAIFTAHPQALQFAIERVRVVLMFQFLACSYEVSSGGMRALGYSLTPMFITICGTCVVRVLWVKAFCPASFGSLLLIYPATWIITGLCMLTAWWIVSRRALRMHTQQIDYTTIP